MGDDSSDPIDHVRTTRQHAGETMKNGVNAPGVFVVGAGVMSLMIGLGSFASGNSVAGIIFVCAFATLVIAGGTWLFVAHRRVRRKELEWHDRHAEGPPMPPAS